MAFDGQAPGGSVDPADDPLAEYDYAGGAVERPDRLAALASRVEGDVRFDEYSRQLYATDASIFEATPVGVVFPEDTADVAAAVSYCAAEGIPVLPRGGGTSLAGQAVNEAVVLDFTRNMDALRDVDPEAGLATAQPGITLGRLDAHLAEHDLTFAPDPAWGEKSALGGAIGNNSTGAHSLVYGKTDAYVESVEVVLADGTITTFGEVDRDDLGARGDPDGDPEARIYAAVDRLLREDSEAVRERYPDLTRNVSGYNLDVLVDEAETGTVNLARLLAGSEGTLAVVTEATVSLEPLPGAKADALLTYDSLGDAVTDVAAVLDHDPAAVELVDDVLLDLAADTAEFGDLVDDLPEGTRSALLVEFYAEDDEAGRAAVDDLLADRVRGEAADRPETCAHHGLEAHDASERERFWALRKSGLPILLSRTGDEKHLSFIEDCAVPPEHLPEYVAQVEEILDDHDTFASFYAHAGPGVLHVRPLVNGKTVEGVETMEAIADEITDVVVEFGGSVSGEHGDGRARTQWNRKLYGDDLWETFRGLKSAFDPDWLLNPGQVCGDVRLTEDHRYGPDYEFDAGFEPRLEWANENGFEGMVELCHGCGGCRGDQDTTGGVMCPTYRAANEESLSTRGRANLLRQAMSGDLPVDEQFDVEFAREVMDLCIGCKGCARDCPSEVDMAKLKAEITHEHHEREGAGLRDRLFANVDAVARLGSATAPVSNWLADLDVARVLLERTLGIARNRSLPTFQRESVRDWWTDRGGARVPEDEASRRVVLLCDPYTTYSHPGAATATVEVLEAAGVHVRLAARQDSGRPAFSKGFLERARDAASGTVAAFAPLVADGWDVVAVEPSDAVMLQSDYRDLLTGDDADAVAANTSGPCEYLDRQELDDGLDLDAPNTTVTYHGHCHQKATRKDHHAVGVLRRAGYAVDALDSGCCGMAGSFGYEAEHHSMSRAIARVLYDQVESSDGDVVAAPGMSCRSQLGDRAGADDPPTPIELVARALA